MTQQNVKNIEKEIHALNNKIDKHFDECASKGIDWEEAIKGVYDDRLKVIELDRELRMIKDPAIKKRDEWKGELMPLEEFMNFCMDGYFVDDDGIGYYATDYGESDIVIYPSDVLVGKVRKDFLYIRWYNR